MVEAELDTLRERNRVLEDCLRASYVLRDRLRDVLDRYENDLQRAREQRRTAEQHVLALQTHLARKNDALMRIHAETVDGAFDGDHVKHVALIADIAHQAYKETL